ncbi:DMT family transporter [Chitinimonas sp. BJYL2]|uniref:DMT family transporter n=1 Tax=Chitinimonas sp. BJYL2 TaxID=2976696 RepID=UPI0022B47569|nr:DMT family transporter [Chitinimonas sp. BJYL2]
MIARPLAYACLALSMSLVGSYVALSKPLTLIFPVFLLGWLRFGAGGLAILHWLKKPVDEAPMSARTKGLVFLESFFGNFLFTVCMLFGVSMTTAVSAGVIMAAIPAVVALMSWFILRERIGLRIWAAIACAAVGIALLGLAKPTHAGAEAAHPQAWLGNLLVFGAVLCEAAYAIIGKKLTGSLGPRRITALINLWGFVLMTPLGVYYALQFDFAAVSAGIWLLFIFYALAASVWTVWLWMTGLKGVPASQAGVFMVMLPVSTALVGVLVLGEPITRLQWLAFAISLAGVLLATLPGRSQRSVLA